MKHSVQTLLDELRAAGTPFESLDELVNTRKPYPAAVPVLLKWLEGFDGAEVMRQQAAVEQVVRALAVSAARGKAAPKLIDLFRELPERYGTDGFRWAIGNTLEVVADDSVLDDLLQLATDRRYGTAREMVVIGLGRMKSPRVLPVLIDLLQDDDVSGHAVIALGKLRATEAVPHISALLSHPKPWVRKEALNALTKIQAKYPTLHARGAKSVE